jgi:hypothetical protein
MKIAPHDQLLAAQTYAHRRPAADPRLAAKQFAAALDDAAPSTEHGSGAVGDAAAAAYRPTPAEPARETRGDAPPPPGSYLDLRV